MNVEWWGAKLASCQVQVGDIRTPCPTLGLSGFSLVARLAAWVGLVAQWMACGTYYTASETLALPGHRASPSSYAICVYLCASVVK